MTPHKQLIVHDPENGRYGDCHRTCIASILDLEPIDVPHFCDGTEVAGQPSGQGHDTYVDRQEAWLAERGLRAANIPFSCSLEELMDQIRFTMRDVPVILGGTSSLGCNHSVVAMNGEIVSDPSGNGIVGPMDDGFYWITIIGVGPSWGTRGEAS